MGKLQNDFEMVDYLCELREGVLEAYTGIVQGLRGDSGPGLNSITTRQSSPNDLVLLESQLPHILQFICEVAKDTEKSDGNISACAGLIG